MVTVIGISLAQLAIFFTTAWMVSIAKKTSLRHRIARFYRRWVVILFEAADTPNDPDTRLADRHRSCHGTASGSGDGVTVQPGRRQAPTVIPERYRKLDGH